MLLHKQKKEQIETHNGQGGAQLDFEKLEKQLRCHFGLSRFRVTLTPMDIIDMIFQSVRGFILLLTGTTDQFDLETPTGVRHHTWLIL